CWGRNEYNQIGDGTTINRNQPTTTNGFETGAVAISAGGFHTCATNPSGQLYCWGHNHNGQIGIGTSGNRISTPTRVQGNLASTNTVLAVSAGWLHTCAIRHDHNGYCWGLNIDGRIGNGASGSVAVPLPALLSDAIVMQSTYAALSAGLANTCGLLYPSNRAVCWGNGEDGTIGDNTTHGSDSPTWVGSSPEYLTQISTGGRSACGRTISGGVRCWGNNITGQVGDGSFSHRYLPVDVTTSESTPLAGVTLLSQAAFHYYCVITSSANALCWGENNVGQLGIGPSVAEPRPVSVIGFP
ncbi:MAG: hypothetical protein FWD57_14270, partial [Polyangiaceae bacterium]|nr:hypothetical protein [Polyangiaceae bacterium]